MPILPTRRTLSMLATAWTTTTKMTGATIILTRAMNQSLSGLRAIPTVGKNRPIAMPSTAPITTCTHSSFRCRNGEGFLVVLSGTATWDMGPRSLHSVGRNVLADRFLMESSSWPPASTAIDGNRRRSTAVDGGRTWGTGVDAGDVGDVGSAVQGLEDLVELGLALEPDARDLGQADPAVHHDGVVGEAAGGLELARVGLVAAELERGRDVQGELVSAVRDAAAGGPAVLAQPVLDPQVLGQPVAQRRVDLDDVAVRAHPAVADQVAGVGQGEQILAGRDPAPVVLGHGRVQGVVQRVADLLVPEQVVRLDRLGVGQRLVQGEPAVDVDREAGPVAAQDVDDGLDPLEVLGQRRAADLHLDHAVALVQELAHLVLQLGQALVRGVVAAGRVHEHRVVDRAVAVVLGQEPV